MYRFARRSTLGLGTALALTLALGSSALAISADRATNSVYWTFDPTTPIGTSSLVRTDAGLSATFQSSGIPAGQAVTLWFIVFNNPSGCDSDPCSILDLLFNPDAEGDFLVGAGNVVGASGRVNLGGALKVGDASGSGFLEIPLPDEQAIGLTNPRGAEVHLALHSHGPAVTGQTLKSQISSFTGGCTSFLGNAGFDGSGIADDPSAIPDAVGECSTLQISVYP